MPHFEAACRLYRGPFLPEDLYADWSLIQRERMTQTHLAMCQALAAHHLEHARYHEATTWSLKILDENRCDESAFRQLMHACAVAGRRGEALRHYQRCAQVLQAELGVQPAPETTALFHAIVRGDHAPALVTATR
jgi:DNA-binding SARP family transcriptional activator